MAKWILTDHRIISSDLNPKIPVVVVIDKSYSKMILDGMNGGRDAILKIEKLKQDKQELRNKILALKAKLARWAKYCEETGIGTPRPGGKRVKVVTAPKEGVITDKDLIMPKTEPVEKPKKLTVEEVLRLPDGPEKKQLESQFTISEKMEAAKIRYKIERENWRRMRRKGFSLDNPIIGVESESIDG